MNILPAPWTQKHQPGDSRGVRQGPHVRWGWGYTGAWLRRDALPMPRPRRTLPAGQVGDPPRPPPLTATLRFELRAPGLATAGCPRSSLWARPSRARVACPVLQGGRAGGCPTPPAFWVSLLPTPSLGVRDVGRAAAGADGKLAPPGDPSGRVCCPSSTAAGGLVQVGL